MIFPIVQGATFLFLAASGAFALEWDTVGENTTADGGSGYWDLTTPNWFNGSSNVLWDSGNAVFGTRSGPYAILRGAIQATSLTLGSRIMIVDDPGGDPYGDTLIPVGQMPISGEFATIEAPVSGSGGLDILGGATLSANNTYTGGTHDRSGVNADSLSAFGSGEVTLHPNTSVIFYSSGAGTISNNFTAEGTALTSGRSSLPTVRFCPATSTCCPPFRFIPVISMGPFTVPILLEFSMALRRPR